ncbi:hypothetical protein CspeluHIS016_0501450 [Cutaneotrichosporon spelunceum]|uniref:Uncharacterized protein n=1 Tax=Cutaneotrichosporon spelunceum TaxID=1672016 RepID=A0AAD3TWP9_9TREE|nr:hypothetical protein CspeluHIS016_0501450 [Cutaneotrichosporon spelunceum]
MSGTSNLSYRTAPARDQAANPMPHSPEEANGLHQSSTSPASAPASTPTGEEQITYVYSPSTQRGISSFSGFLPRLIRLDKIPFAEEVQQLQADVDRATADIEALRPDVIRLQEQYRKHVLSLNLLEDKALQERDRLDALKDQLKTQRELHEQALVASVYYQETLQMKTTEMYADIEHLVDNAVRERSRVDVAEEQARVVERALEALARRREAQAKLNSEAREELDLWRGECNKLRAESDDLRVRIAVLEAQAKVAQSPDKGGYACCIQ